MRPSFRIIVAFFAIFLSGCVSLPENPDQLRKMTSKSRINSFTVNRPFKKVVSTFSKRGKVCLSKSVVTTITSTNPYGGSSSSRITNHFTPSLKRNGNGVVLTLQSRMEGSFMLTKNRGKGPKDGNYVLLVDIEPAGRSKTKLAIYRIIRAKSLVKAIQNWAEGSNLGCPNMTKVM